ncbi:MAG: hypothetical protein QM811_18425 [Pirellulales bacterium]
MILHDLLKIAVAHPAKRGACEREAYDRWDALTPSPFLLRPAWGDYCERNPELARPWAAYQAMFDPSPYSATSHNVFASGQSRGQANLPVAEAASPARKGIKRWLAELPPVAAIGGTIVIGILLVAVFEAFKDLRSKSSNSSSTTYRPITRRVVTPGADQEVDPKTGALVPKHLVRLDRLSTEQLRILDDILDGRPVDPALNHLYRYRGTIFTFYTESGDVVFGSTVERIYHDRIKAMLAEADAATKTAPKRAKRL